MSDMLQFVEEIGNSQVRCGVTNNVHCLSACESDDKLKHVGHLDVRGLTSAIVGDIVRKVGLDAGVP